MAKSLKQWVKEDAEPIKKLMTSHPEQFFRDPVRPIYHNEDYFYSPADGVILYTFNGDVKDKLFEVKGKNFTIKELTGLELTGEFIVVGVFMTQCDVHINRMSYPGYLSYWQLPPIKTKNLPMLHEEEDLLKGVVKYNDMDYMFYNERVINKVRTKLGFDYYIVQMGDYDVDTITPFFIEQNKFVQQNNRFSMIRFGSQVDLIVPIVKGFEYKILAKKTEHVEAGIDTLIEIRKKQ